MDSILKAEAKLLRASLNGNKEAFGRIVEGYQSLICSITYSASGNQARSEELAQEVFVRAWKGLGQLRDVNSFRAWICTIAWNLVRKHVSKEQEDVTARAVPLERADQALSRESGPAESAVSKEHEDLVWSALKGIPQLYREPLVLFYREQQSVRQVAADLDLSEDAVKQRLSRGRKLLRSEVASLVEDVIGRTKPGKVFTVAVIAALPAVSSEAAGAVAVGLAAKGTSIAKSAFLSGLSGAVIGPIAGLLGGLLGGYMSIKNTKSSRERRFMIVCGIVVWVGLLILIAVPLLLALAGFIPKWAYWICFGLFFVFLVPFIFWGNRQQQLIRKEDGAYTEMESRRIRLSRPRVYWSLGGAIFGAVSWIFVISSITKDWLSCALVCLFAGLLFIVSVNKCGKDVTEYWRIVIWDMISLCGFNLVMANWRWNYWMSIYRQSSAYSRVDDIPLWAMNVIILMVFFGLLGVVFFVSRRRQDLGSAQA